MQNDPQDTPRDNVIRITLEEGNSTHVDDLLKRQMSLRGETGITRDSKRRWYYQNWFVFLIAGTLAAAAAWAIINPYFQDYEYVQGPVESINTTDDSAIPPGEESEHLKHSAQGIVKINGDHIVVLSNTELLSKEKRKRAVDIDNIQEGQVVGFYVKYFDAGNTDGGIAYYADLSPNPARNTTAPLSKLASTNRLAAFLVFPLVAGLVGLSIGAVDGLVCRLPRRALLAGAVGLLVGLVGGFISEILAGMVYSPLNHYVEQQVEKEGAMTAFGFVIQITGRALAWCVAGMAMGLGQGIALRSKRLLLYGFIGGVVGGLLGGLFFDPVYFLIQGGDSPSAQWARLIGFSIIGAAVGGMIGLVELLARDAWLRMIEGPLAGKEFLVFKDVMNVGASPRNDIYLFNDPLVAPQHATIRSVGDECELHAATKDRPTMVNNRAVTQTRLRHGDSITIGKTIFVYQKRQG